MLFENELGMAQPLMAVDLENLLQGSKISTNIKCVFLAACYSSNIAKVFLRAGIKHVICTNRVVDNAAAGEFTKHFYASLIGTSQCFCNSFKFAISRLRAHNNDTIRKEWPKFMHLSQCTEDYCLRTGIDQFDIGEFVNFDEEPTFRIERLKPIMFERKRELDTVHQRVN